MSDWFRARPPHPRRSKRGPKELVRTPKPALERFVGPTGEGMARSPHQRQPGICQPPKQTSEPQTTQENNALLVSLSISKVRKVPLQSPANFRIGTLYAYPTVPSVSMISDTSSPIYGM